ncbi:uncharacterized protein LOC126567409 [Anopheles maculipalpis]|uniref:uncharacterized protein LOC126567409 n=1 Tax=Anopheles maculipalpis TaxID=1496333 RepID=UPI002158F1A3|nr:uncharacterized protein LOC126567409 [Anopheles maculipalpis]
MAEVCKIDKPHECVVELECTENSQPFETRIVTIVSGGEKLIGRYHKEKRTKAFASQEGINVLFDNRTLSQAHATLLFKEGKLYLKDLCSANGTYVNGKNIGPNERDQREPVARPLKTGDIVRFGKLRAISANSDVIRPIEAKVTIKFPIPSELNDQSENNEKCLSNYTPFEGRGLDQTITNEPEPMKQSNPEPSDNIQERNDPIKSLKAVEQDTQTEAAKLQSSSTQVLPEEETDQGEKEDKNECNACESLIQEFYQHRKRSLMAIVVCLLIAIIYQHRLII